MKLMAATGLLLIATTSLCADELCVEPGRICSDTTGVTARVVPADVQRRFTWRLIDSQWTILGTLAPGQSEIQRPDPDRAPAFAFQLAGQKNREWPADVSIEVTAGANVWTWTLPKRDASTAQRVYVPPGVYKLTFRAPHHRPLVYARLAVGGTKVSELGRLTLPPAIRIIGTVTSADRPPQPLPGVVVTGVDGAQFAVTDRAGVFAFETDSAPELIALAHPGYADRLLSVSRGGATIDMGAIRLGKGVTLACAIDRTQLDEPTALDVELYQEWGVERALRRCRSGHLSKEQKTLRFEGLEPGRYVALIKGPDQLRQFTAKLDVDDAPLTTAMLAISPVHLRLGIQYGGEPLPSAHVTLVNEGRFSRRVWKPQLTTDERGVIEGELWQSGQLSAEVRHDRFESVFIDFREIGGGDAAVWTIDVPRQSIVGSVRDAETNQPIANARVVDEVTVEGSLYTHVTRITDERGEFRFSTALNAEHALTVQAAGYASEKPIAFELRDTPEKRVDIALRRGETVKLTVVDANGVPVAGASVLDGFVESGLNPKEILKTDDGGELLITGRKGDRHSLVVIPPGGSFAFASVVNGETEPEMAVHVPPGVGTLRIEAVTREGQPLALLRFVARYNGAFLLPAAISIKSFAQRHRRNGNATAPDGVLLLDQLPEGTYELWPFTTELELEQIQRGARAALATVRVTAGETSVRVVVEPRG